MFGPTEVLVLMFVGILLLSPFVLMIYVAYRAWSRLSTRMTQLESSVANLERAIQPR